ncbi:hypothetical protein BU26DRAFT_134999 [Trematosphaeria pertusa]|uniref:Uncharacterized protein n=1 Tax=Trematosphaeria pertusa TaxID=390896 RepID=A0A6A6IUH6_9PLEO|nr:uncharacterized protein BU26DRAFT_134999 [Trematosphaeria pertusa]KAF2254211.1 hypothetical protein BU26DRAFT_134999 [Trematosphaeria pertusa]
MVAAGSRYCHLAQRLRGLGVLAFLPQCGGPSLWENHIGKSGTAFEKVAKKLQDDGLPAKSEPYHELAGDIVAVGKGDISTADLVQKHCRTNRSPDGPEHTRKRPRVAREEGTVEAFQLSNLQGHGRISEPPSQMGPATFFALPRVAGEQSSSTRPESTDSAGIETSNLVHPKALSLGDCVTASRLRYNLASTQTVACSNRSNINPSGARTKAFAVGYC